MTQGLKLKVVIVEKRKKPAWKLDTHSIVPPSCGSTHSLLINNLVLTDTLPEKSLVSTWWVKTDEVADIVRESKNAADHTGARC